MYFYSRHNFYFTPTALSKNIIGRRPNNLDEVAISGVKSDLTIELEFNKPVNRTSVENNFKIYSEDGKNRNFLPFTITQFQFDFSWDSESKVVRIKPKKNLLQTSNGEELRYKITFDESFRDKEGNFVYVDNVSSENMFFKFGQIEKSYFLISLENDNINPKLDDLSYNYNGNLESIQLSFSEPMDVYNKRSENLIEFKDTNNIFTKLNCWLENNNTILKCGNNSNNVNIFTTYTIQKYIIDPNGNIIFRPFDIGITKPNINFLIDNTGNFVKLEYTPQNNQRLFLKNEFGILEVSKDIKDSSGNKISTNYIKKIEGVDTTDNIKVFKVIN